VVQTRLQKGYCIDTSALIGLDSYPEDVFPRLWEDMEGLVNDGLLIAPSEVYRELGRKYEGDVQKWTRKHREMFVDLDEEQIKEVKAIQHTFPNLVDPNKTMPDADPFLIALARCRGGWVVVTLETVSKNIFKPKIPNVCEYFGVKYINLLGLFRECNWKY